MAAGTSNRREFFKTAIVGAGGLWLIPELAVGADAGMAGLGDSPTEISLSYAYDADSSREAPRGIRAEVQCGAERARSAGDLSSIASLSRSVAFNGGGHHNHSVFWDNMAPGGGDPVGGIRQQIVRDFGSMSGFRAQFTAASKPVEGSGWAVLG